MATADRRRTKDAASNRSGRLLDFYRQLLVVRTSEERLATLFANGDVPGFIHLSIGQEAISVGVMSALNRADTIGSTHRGHGHAIAKGIPLDRFFAELLAKETGVCQGRGGSMHVADMSVGMLGANGIVAAGVPIATGSALAHRTRGTGDVAVSFFGDGALAEGVIHESLNIASLLKLPILYVCEANGWSEFSAVGQQIAFAVDDWCRAYAIPFHQVDGNDVDAVAEIAERIVADIRKGGGPAFLECKTTRIRGHYEGDAQKYRDPEEQVRSDPIQFLRAELTALGVSDGQLDDIVLTVEAEVDAAIVSARSAGPATFEAAMRDVYTTGAL
ncbi:MAG: thiamine pyrophosphate-dependent dehydrogenase E1 component subunit alpha [Sphingobium sp.]|nr:thiamine pyrophosphate-dependent dehydrogenase E1 component subunit alpha [Sphingobium sp.]MBP9157600.1 thiamine pyrophosphate-dependent dehydrogenase E1 component subunit alpha [Sphingobium sp.]